jgi:hypothetical protein
MLYLRTADDPLARSSRRKPRMVKASQRISVGEPPRLMVSDSNDYNGDPAGKFLPKSRS